MSDRAEDFNCTVEDGFTLIPEANPKAKVVVQERDYSICLTTPTLSEPILTVAEARELARRLYILAKRVERKIGDHHAR